MAITTLVAATDISAVNRVTVNYKDYNKILKGASLDVIPNITNAQLVTLANTIETISNAMICSVKMNEVLYKTNVDSDAAIPGDYAEVYDYARFTFIGLRECRSVVAVDILAPEAAIFTGEGLMFVDQNNADVIAFVNAVLAVLKDKKYGGVVDFELQGGVRGNTGV